MVMKIRNLFLDNNVIIGFLYKLDSLNPHSEHIINSNDNFYYSYHVKQEMEKVIVRKNDEYDKFFLLLKSKLKKHDDGEFISQSSFHTFIENFKSVNKLNVKNMHYAFDYMWNFFDFGENGQVSDVKLKFRKFRYSFGRNHVSRKVKFIKNANYIPAHTRKDQKIIDMN